MRKRFICMNDGQLFVSPLCYQHEQSIMECPIVDGKYVTCLDVLDIDLINKTASYNAEKHQARKNRLDGEKIADDAALQARADNQKALKDSLTRFNSLTAAEKWELVKKLIEVL